ncbi:MAG: hypothetical protein ABJP48_13400 [Erythrobacter sp.]
MTAAALAGNAASAGAQENEQTRWTIEMPSEPNAPAARTALRSGDGAEAEAQDSHDRLANQEVTHLVQQGAPRRNNSAAPAASTRLRSNQPMVEHNLEFVRFYRGEGDAKVAITDGHRASSHRRILPIGYPKRLDSISSMVIGMAVANCAVGSAYPNLVLKRGTFAVEATNATITHCGENSTAMSVELTNATVSEIRTEQQN